MKEELAQVYPDVRAKEKLTLNELFTPTPTTIFEFSSRYLTLTNQDHKDFLRNTRNAVELVFKSFENRPTHDQPHQILRNLNNKWINWDKKMNP